MDSYTRMQNYANVYRARVNMQLYPCWQWTFFSFFSGKERNWSFFFYALIKNLHEGRVRMCVYTTTRIQCKSKVNSRDLNRPRERRKIDGVSVYASTL